MDKKHKFHVKEISSGQELEELLCTKGIKFIQVYAQWCGMSQTMVPVYKTLREKYDDENALLFCSIQAEKVEHTWEDPKGYEHLEAVYNRKGKSEPLFLIYRNGNLLEAVRGQNTPLIVRTIEENFPVGPDADDLEQNGVLIAIKERAHPANTQTGGRRRRR